MLNKSIKKCQLNRCAFYYFMSKQNRYSFTSTLRETVSFVSRGETKENIEGREKTKLTVSRFSLSPSCLTRKKTAGKKWPRELLEARSAQKEGQLTLSHHARRTI